MIVLVGETASGKSDVAMLLAQRLNGEIINADSWAVYKGFDIGTAKPSKEEQELVQHHLIDVADPAGGFNAVLYKELANQAIAQVSARGKLPILSGGTGLYIDSVIYDYKFLPAVSKEERDERSRKTIGELVAEADRRGIELGGIDIRNKRRIIRALEAGGLTPERATMRPGTVMLGILTERDTLRERITRRVDRMIEQGLEKEVSGLADRYGWQIEPMKGIGYVQWREYFEGSQNLEQTRLKIISATMNLAKRQRTWFKRNNHIQWVDDPSKIVDIATTRLNTFNS